MRPHIRILVISLIIIQAACQSSDRQDEAATELAGNRDSLATVLSTSLTFHASFDDGPDADFGTGDLKLYSGDFNNRGEKSANTTVGLGNPPLSVVKDKGKYGGALEFTVDNTHTVFYNLDGNFSYAEQDFNGTASFWMSLHTEDIPSRYCDPVQLCEEYYAGDCMWVDITKNDVPPDFRLGVFGDHATWDKDNKEGSAEEFFWRLLKTSNPPFSRGTWTHVAFTWEKLNTAGIGRAKLYINGKYAGQSGPIREPMKWNVANATFRMGTGKYVGLFDDVALFSRAFSEEEIGMLYSLTTGVEGLHKSN